VKGTFRLDVPGDTMASVTLTATINEWRAFLKATAGTANWPVGEARRIIDELVRAAEKQFTVGAIDI
jgi:hypothetical protein